MTMQEKTKREKPKKEFEEMLLEVRRVTRVNTWGRQLSFRAIILVGNKNGKIWLGVSKGSDVQIAVRKATNEAYKNMKVIPITESGSIPYMVSKKYKSAYITLIPAAPGSGLKAGSSLRSVMELAGYTNILSKIMGTRNKLNNALAAVMALTAFKVDRSKLEKLDLQGVMETRKRQQAEADAERAAKSDRRKPRRTENDNKKWGFKWRQDNTAKQPVIAETATVPAPVADQPSEE